MSIHEDKSGWFVVWYNLAGEQKKARFGKGRKAEKSAKNFEKKWRADKADARNPTPPPAQSARPRLRR